jgi:hypothetical protein
MRKAMALAALACMLLVSAAPIAALDLPLPDCSPENCGSVPPSSGEWPSCRVEVQVICVTSLGPCIPFVFIWCD